MYLFHARFVTGVGRKKIPMSVHLDRHRTAGVHDECWLWRGPVSPGGYGHIRTRSRSVTAHRVAYEEFHGVSLADPSVVVRHSCDNMLCTNPHHLALGTQLDNIRDKVSRGRQAKGVGQAKAKLDDEKVRDARRQHNAGVTLSQLADRFGVATSTLHSAVTGQTWGHVR